MSKQQRHERKKVERARRHRALARHPTLHMRHGAAALAAAATIAAGTSAYAGPVRFDNPAHGDPDHFHWAVPQGDNTNWLDFTSPASQQPGPIDSATTLRHIFSAGASGTVANPPPDPVELQRTSYFLEGVGAGALIPTGFSWAAYGYVYYPGYGSYLSEGTPTYLGFRFNFDGVDWQYGWIGVVRTVEQLEAFAWGYETDPGVPIAAGAATIPEPGTLALLALGAAGLSTRPARRRQMAN